MNRMQYQLMAGAWGLVLGITALSSVVWAQGQAITFSATGDVPYSSSQAAVFQEQLANHNRYSPSAFFAHVGDIFAGGESCDEFRYSTIAAMLKGLAVPVFIVPGDNETIDCSSPAQGLSHWLQNFQNFEQNFCGAPYTERQSTHPENFAFTMNGVLFVGINMVGGSSPYQPDAEWVSQQFQAHGSQVRAAVIFSHTRPNHSTQFSTPFRQAAVAFGKPILFLHGHGHSWSVNYPFPEQNILRVQVDNGSAEDPVEVTVTAAQTTNPDSMFILKRNPWSNQVVYNMPPCVNAGPDQVISLPSLAMLQGQATDDGDPNPPGAVTVAWSKVSGPGTVTFENANALATTASFNVGGTYVLRLAANDGALQSSDELTIVVKSQIVYEETQTGGSANSPTVATSAPLTGVSGHLYLAAISTQPRRSVVGVTGLGLNWTLVKEQCSGLNTIAVEVWMAQGIPQGGSNGVVTATLASASSAAVIAVSRYSGVAVGNPLGNVISGNTNGVPQSGASAVCSGGVPSDAYSFNLTTTVNDAVVYSAVAMKGRTHAPGAGYTERAEIREVGNNLTSSIAVEDTAVAVAGSVPVHGSFSGTADWAEIGVVIKPQGSGPAQHTLTVNTVGSGEVTLDPLGGTYDAGTEVTLTATPEAGFQFGGWSGDLSGSTNPATITMDGNKTVTATFKTIVHEETQTGGSANSTTVTTATPLTGVSGNLYLAAISTQPRQSVTSVSGLGLTWTLVREQCSGLNTIAVEVWKAQGTPSGNGVVTATLTGAPSAAVIAVSRYSGVAAGSPIGNVISGNTNGANANAVCSGGVPSDAYAFNLATSVNDAVVYSAVAMKGRTHEPGAGYTERTEVRKVGGGLTSSIAIEDTAVAVAGSVPVNGLFSGTADWAEVGLVLKPQTAGPTHYTLTVNKVGSGIVTRDPLGGTYVAGTVVTLTATPDAGFVFGGWSGDLSGSANPATITMDGNKTVTATFKGIVHEEIQTGGSTNSTVVATATNLTGVSGNLYLAAISTQPRQSVAGVSGLGLSWTLVKEQCSGLNTIAVEVWMAQGTPSGNGVVTATLANAPSAAVIAVSRYSGVAATNAIGNVISGNTNGVPQSGTNAVCSGGVPSDAYSFNLATTANNAVVYSAVAMKGRTHVPGTNYTEQAEVRETGGGLTSSIAVEDMTVITAGSVTVDGIFSGTADWAEVGLEIKPQGTISKRGVAAGDEELAAPPAAYRLEQNYPNPFNPSTIIDFALPEAGKVTVNIYNATGQLVRTLVDGEMAAGRHAVSWNGRNQSGETVAAGIYLYRLVVHGEDGNAAFAQTQRMTFFK